VSRAITMDVLDRLVQTIDGLRDTASSSRWQCKPPF
jgi:hypothetical protein